MRACSVDGCSREVKTRAMCGMHYRRWQRSGDPGEAGSRRGGKSCSVDGCQRAYKARGFCNAHYQRWKATGSPGGAELLRKPAVGLCRVPDCPNEVLARQLCQKHLHRLYRHGEEGLARVMQRDPEHALSYYGAHIRTRARRGHAAEYSCVDCGNCAAEWSYRHDDPKELIDERGIQYSADPLHYDPRCVPCHRRFDLDRIESYKKTA